MALREEAFLHTANIEATSGVTFGVTRPAKHLSNPLAFPGSGSSSPNYHELSAVGGAVLEDNSIALALLGANTGFAGIVPAYAGSVDGVTFTQPNLGSVNWGGNTNNNVMYPTGLGDVSAGGSGKRWSITAHFYHEDTAEWVVMMRGWDVNFGGFLYTSPNPYGPWTFASTVYAYNTGFPSVDPGTIVRRADGRWLSYYQKMNAGFPQTGIPNGYYAGRRRDLGVLLSDSTDLFGTWTDLGAVLTATQSSRQYYGATAWLSGETVCVGVWIFDGTDNVPAANTFNGTIDRVHKIALYTSHDGIALTLADDDWLASTGSTGDWDGGEVLTNGVPVTLGDETHIYYAGDDACHHQDWVAQGNRRYLGRGSWNRNRLGYIEGPGEVRLAAQSAAEAAALTLNSTGTVRVELLSLANDVLTGYSRTDSVPITADGYENAVTWTGGRTVTPTDFKTVLVLAAGARVYFAQAQEALAAGLLLLDLSGGSLWSQDGASLTVTPAVGVPADVTAIVTSGSGGPVRFRGEYADRFQVSLDGAAWASQVVVGAGDTTVFLRVTAQVGDTTITAQVGVPA